MKKLLIIDGSALLFQSFYGMPKKIVNHKGRFVEAVICFVGIMQKTLKLIEPDKLLIVFDGENKLERKELDENYKANRVDFSNVSDADNPFLQLEIIKDVLSRLNYQWVETKNCEADDLIASVVNDYKSQFEIVVSSSDKDFFQLIDEKVSVFVYRGKVSKLWINNEIFAKYGFEAKYFSTLKALMGDSADNIKGIKGVGLKTATKLIQKFGDYENIYKNLDLIDKKLADLLADNKDEVLKNYKMVELHSKTNLFDLPECDLSLYQGSSTGLLKEMDII